MIYTKVHTSQRDGTWYGMIDIDILAEELGGKAVRGSVGRHERLDLGTVRLCTGEQTSYDRGVLYVIDSSEVWRAQQCGSGAAFAVTGAATALEGSVLADCLDLTAGPTKLEAMGRIQEVFERYEGLDRRVTDAVLEERSVDTVLDLLSGVLKNPFALFDSACVFIGKAGTVSATEADQVWQGVLEEGYAASQNMSQSEMLHLQNNPEPFVSEYEGIQTLRVSLRVRGEVVGFLGSTRISAPFTEGQVSAMHWVKLLLERVWPLLSSRSDLAGISDQLVLQLINRTSVSRNMVERYLARRSWKIDDTYRMLLLYQPEGAFNAMDTEHLRRLITAISPLAIVMQVRDGLLVVVHSTSTFFEDAKGALASFMEKRGLQMTVSSEVYSFLDLWKAYGQCRAARTVAGEQDGAVVPFGAVCGRYLMHALEASTDLEALCHPKVAAMAERPRGEEFVHSLRLYLINGRSLTHAANALYVHRNTLIYRIEKIEEMLGIDLSDADEDQLLYLYFSCLVVEHDVDERATGA